MAGTSEQVEHEFSDYSYFDFDDFDDMIYSKMIPQKSSMPRRAAIYINLIFFVIGRGTIFLPCVKNLQLIIYR